MIKNLLRLHSFKKKKKIKSERERRRRRRSRDNPSNSLTHYYSIIQCDFLNCSTQYKNTDPNTGMACSGKILNSVT